MAKGLRECCRTKGVRSLCVDEQRPPVRRQFRCHEWHYFRLFQLAPCQPFQLPFVTVGNDVGLHLGKHVERRHQLPYFSSIAQPLFRQIVERIGPVGGDGLRPSTLIELREQRETGLGEEEAVQRLEVQLNGVQQMLVDPAEHLGILVRLLLFLSFFEN
mgnify:CR=1 FL=1